MGEYSCANHDLVHMGRIMVRRGQTDLAYPRSSDDRIGEHVAGPLLARSQVIADGQKLSFRLNRSVTRDKHAYASFTTSCGRHVDRLPPFRHIGWRQARRAALA